MINPNVIKERLLEIDENLKILFAIRILPMAGLRNILIHEYFKIDLERIYQHLQNLEDFRTFQKHIIKFLKAA